jgi:hypothetical protein
MGMDDEFELAHLHFKCRFANKRHSKAWWMATLGLVAWSCVEVNLLTTPWPVMARQFKVF